MIAVAILALAIGFALMAYCDYRHGLQQQERWMAGEEKFKRDLADWGYEGWSD